MRSFVNIYLVAIIGAFCFFAWDSNRPSSGSSDAVVLGVGAKPTLVYFSAKW